MKINAFVRLLHFLPAILCCHLYGQPDTTTKPFTLNTEVSILSKNVWRGLDYGTSPAAQGTLGLKHEYFEIGSFATATLNGNKLGFGTWIELYITGKYKNFQLTVDDYFFFNATDSLNNYFDWNQDKTQHFIEGRLKYDSEKLDLTAGYCFYRNIADQTTGVYFEGEYSPFKSVSFIVGGLTSSSWLSFYDKGGLTTIGASGKRELKITDSFSLLLKCSLLFNPNYRNSLPDTGVGNNPVYFVIGLTL